MLADKYRFSDGNVFNHAEEWSRLFAPYVGKPDVRSLEVGSYEGKSAVWLLDNVLTNSMSWLTCIDCWSDDVNDGMGGRAAKDVFDANITASGRWHSVESMHDRSEHALRDLFTVAVRDGFYDTCYIDAGHDARSVLTDSVLAWPLVKPGGLIVWDDYLWPLGAGETDRPRLAIDSFMNVYAGCFDLLHIDWQVAIRKK